MNSGGKSGREEKHAGESWKVLSNNKLLLRVVVFLTYFLIENTVCFKNFKKEILQLEGAYQYEELVQLYNHTPEISSYRTITADAGVD